MNAAWLRDLLRRGSAGAEARAGDSIPPDELIDAFFDREAGGADLSDALKRSAPAAGRVERIQSMLDELRRPTRSRDLSASILAEVGRRRPWLPASMRRFVTGGRLAAAACFLLFVGGAFYAQRIAPDSVRFTTEPAPLTDLVSAGRADAASGMRTLAAAIDCVREAASSPKCVAETLARPAPSWDQTILIVDARPSRALRGARPLEARSPCAVVRLTHCQSVANADMPQPTMVFYQVRRIGGPDQVMFQMRTPDLPAAYSISSLPPR